MSRRITIVGGGLAGLTLGILLRREGIEATVIEAGKYPRHRVCGEFISGHGRRILNELSLDLPGNTIRIKTIKTIHASKEEFPGRTRQGGFAVKIIRPQSIFAGVVGKSSCARVEF